MNRVSLVLSILALLTSVAAAYLSLYSRPPDGPFMVTQPTNGVLGAVLLDTRDGRTWHAILDTKTTTVEWVLMPVQP